MNTRIGVLLAAVAGSILFGQAVHAEVTRLSEPVAVTDDAEVFGAPLNPDARLTSLAAVLDDPRDYLDTVIRVDTRISKVCQKKGCFMIASSGGQAIRISFKDYAFFVPTDTGGKTVTLTGTLIERSLSEEEAAHFREDAGSDEIRPGKTYEIVADSVSIPRA
jgi:hypothetical protein